MRSEKWYSSLSLALTVWMLTSFSAPYWGGIASGKPSCKGTETPATETETKHCLRKGSCIALAGMKLIFLAGASTVLSCLLDLNHDRSQMESKIIRTSNKTRHGYKTNLILSQALTSSRGTGSPGGREGQKSSPGARGGTGGAVQAALWQRPAEICRTFLPCSTVTSVGSRTWFVWPSPSCRDNSQLSEQQLTADAKTSYLFTSCHKKYLLYIYIFTFYFWQNTAPAPNRSNRSRRQRDLKTAGDFLKNLSQTEDLIHAAKSCIAVFHTQTTKLLHLLCAIYTAFLLYNVNAGL